MYYWVTILAFSVVIPFAVGVRFYNRIPSAYRIIVWLCGVWIVAEIYSFTIASLGISNAHVSYVLTLLELWLFTGFYYRIIHRHRSTFMAVVYLGAGLVLGDAVLIGTPLNTFSLTVEYIVLTCFCLYLFYLIIIGAASVRDLLINFTLLFYLLSSFPYFFAWHWLRTSNMDMLLVFANIHSVVHALCYQVIAYTIWKSQSSYSVQP